MRAINVGVIGCGGIAQMMHLPTLTERPDLFRLVGLADISKVALDAVGDRYQVPFRTTDLRELCARPDIEMVMLLASGSHKDAAIAALQADKHLFSEKPLGIGFGELDAIAAAQRTSRGRVMVGYHKRFDPAYRRAREAVKAIEDLRFVQVTVLHPDDNVYRTHHSLLPLRQYVEPSESELNKDTASMIGREPYAALIDEIAGKGTSIDRRVASFLLYDSLLHDVNAVRGMIGEPEEVLYAGHWNNGFAQTSVTRFAKDVRTNISWVSLPGIRHYEESILFVGPRSRVKLVFPSPYLRHAPTPLVIERMEDGELVEEHRTVSYEEAFRAELHHFHRAIVEGKEPLLSIDEAYRDTAWIQAIASAFSGMPALVPSSREAETLPG